MSNRSRSFYLAQVGLSILLALSFLAVAGPTKALAATACVSYYTVQEKDTAPRIAHKFDLKWKEIAKANKLVYPYTLTPGQKLCIPEDGTTKTSTTPSGKLAVKAVNRLITITASGFSNRSAFNVRVRDGSASIGGWYKVGSFKVSKNTTETVQYAVPNDLRSALYLQVCLKNVTTDELICRTVLRSYK